VRIALLRQYGNFTQAYSATFQSNLEHFGDERGFIAYKRVGGTTMVLGDAVAAPENVDGLIDRFLRVNSDVAFWQISRPLAGMLAARRFSINELGSECRLELATYSFDGQRRRNLRKATQRITKLGYSLRECPLSEIDVAKLTAVSSAWRRTRTIRSREVSFLNRPINFEEEPQVRWFFGFTPANEIAGFCVCDPIYEAGDVIGYSMSSRQLPNVEGMLGHALKRHAIETFQREGRRWVTLGLSPADGIEDKDFERDWLMRRTLRLAYTNGLFNRFIYPLQGHAMHKRQFDGTTYQTYAALNRRPSWLRLLKLLRAGNIL
jgi:lysylphosphatidylglycerol synthetase-like protein (DUF2156 family)